MPVRLPLACTKFKFLKQAEITPFTLNIVNGLEVNAATFPSPPISPISLSDLVDDWQFYSTNAINLGKENVAAKNNAKFAIINALRADASYVNQIIQNLIFTGTSYPDAQTLILGTGYPLSKTPTPAGELPSPDVIKYYSTKKGQIAIKFSANRNAKGMTIQYRPVTSPVSPFINTTWPNSRVTLYNLVSSTTYEIQGAYVGANPARNYSIAIMQVCI